MLIPQIPTTTPPAQSELLSYNASAPLGKQIPSPIGQPFFSLRLGVAESDRPSYFGGISYEVPVSLGIHLVSIRGDADIWEHFTGGNSGGGTDLGVVAIFGPKSSYFGAGIAYAARIDHASGPTGPGVKLVIGGQPIPVVGYEFDLIAGNRGAVGAVMATLHF